MKISKNINESILQFKKELNFEHNFDMISREFYIGIQKCCAFLIDGDGSAQVTTIIMDSFLNYKSIENKYLALEDVTERVIPFVEIATETDTGSAIDAMMMGSVILIIDKISAAFVIDAKSFPQRMMGEPEKDKVIRGSRDGFVEIPIFNSALIRRRIRSTQLVMEGITVGEKSKSDIVVCYMKDRGDLKFPLEIIEKIKNLKIEALTMNQETLSENIFPPKWYNPFPLVRYSERPDETSAALLQGSVIVLIDNSPAAMILPSKFLDFLRDANDYYFPPITGFYYRLIKMFIMIISLFLTPVWLYFMNNQEFIPKWLEVIKMEENASIPILGQLLTMEFILEVMRISTINTPNVLGGSIGLVGALLVGEFAVSSGWLTSETVFYMAFLGVALYAAPNFEFGYAIKFSRIVLLLLTSFFGIWGLAGGTIGLFILIATTKTVSGKPYLSPLIPLNIKKLVGTFSRGKLRR